MSARAILAYRVIRTSDVDPAAIGALVAAAEQAAHAAPDARDSAPLLSGSGVPDDWNQPVPETGAEVFADVAESLSSGFSGTDRLYGYAHHLVETTFLATSTGLRRASPNRPGRWRSTPSVTVPAPGQASVRRGFW